MVESIKSSKHSYGVGFLTVLNLFSRRCRTFEVENIFKPQELDFSLKKGVALASSTVAAVTLLSTILRSLENLEQSKLYS